MEKLKKEEIDFMKQVKKLDGSGDFKNNFGKFRAKFKEGLDTYAELLEKPVGVLISKD